MVQKTMMHPVRRRKLLKLSLGLLVLACVAGLAMYALRQNISLFYTPSDAISGRAPLHHNLRLGGMVVQKSIQRGQRDLMVRFKITDYQNQIEVLYNGILPDLFREGQGVVVQGELIDDHHFKAIEVLAKHDENYMPPEVKSTLKNKPEARA